MYEPGFYGFENIPCATKSALSVADALDKGGAVFGKTIISDSSHFVFKESIKFALQEVVARMKVDSLKYKRECKSFNPFLIFYYCGHGIADQEQPTLRMVPGNFTNNLSASYADELDSLTFSYSDLNEYLFFKARLLNFIILFDCCYDSSGQHEIFFNSNSIFSEIYSKQCRHIRKQIQRQLEREVKDCLNYTIYSTTIGNVISPLENGICPIANHLTFIYKTSTELSLEQLIEAFKNENNLCNVTKYQYFVYGRQLRYTRKSLIKLNNKL